MEKPSLSLKDTGRIYLDYNATTPPHPGVLAELPQWASLWGNPSSIHWLGRGPKNVLRDSRQAVANLIGAHPLEIVFTSGGSESNNLVLKGVFDNLNLPTGGSPQRNEYITSAVEHPSVLKTFEYLKSRGAVVHYIPVNRQGILDLEYYKKVLSERTALVSVMAANNETGTLFPVREMAKMARNVGALFHADCVQLLGKCPVHVGELGVDFATFSGHKFYALKGAGVVYAKKGQRLVSLIAGGGQERGRRGGTENLLAIAAIGYMAEKFQSQIEATSCQMLALRERLESKILKEIFGVHLTGADVERLPNTSSFVIDDVDGESLLINLDMAGVSVSTGAACSSGSPEPSPVLLAMGLKRFEAQSSLRISLGWDTTQAEVDQFLEILKNVVKRLRTLREESRQAERQQGAGL
jgi:cysteine desulfurase